MANLTESVVGDAVLAWLESLGYVVTHGTEILPVGDTLTPTLSQWERENYSEVVLADRWRQLLQKIQQLRKKQCAKNAYCFEAAGLRSRVLPGSWTATGAKNATVHVAHRPRNRFQAGSSSEQLLGRFYLKAPADHKNFASN